MRTLGRVLLTCILIYVSSACGNGDAGPATPEPAGADFELSVLTAGNIGHAGTSSLRQYQAGGDTCLEISLDGAEGLKAFYFELTYDPGSYIPVTATATDLLSAAGGESARVLEIADLGNAGCVSHGQVLAGYDELAGFTGSGTVAVLRFTAGACGFGRRVSTPPRDEEDRPVLRINEDFSMLDWDHHCPGDYDQNGRVTVSDLTPLGRLFYSEPPYAPGSVEAIVDGDGDGLITVADITPIGRNYDIGVDYYEVFYTIDEIQRPENNTFKWDALERVKMAEAIGEPGKELLTFEIHQPVPAPNGWFWLCSSQAGERGVCSASIEVGAPANEAPEAIILVNARSGETPMTVSFDGSASRDSDGSIVRYEWDWDMNDDVWDWQDGGDSPLAEYTFHLPGYFYIVLRVTDDQGALGWDLLKIPVAQGPNQDPVAFFEPDLWETVAMQKIAFDASRSFDWDGEIVLYRWDFNSNGTIDDEEETPEVEHAFTEPGTYEVTLYVEDDEGLTGSCSRTVTILENQPPVAMLAAGPLSGSAPLDVTFDPAGSYDPEGDLAEVHWNLGGNRIEKKLRDGLTREDLLEPVTQTFYMSGQYECTLCLIDGQDQSSEVLAETVSVTGMSSERWDLPNSPVRVDFLDLKVIDNRLALVTSGYEGSERCVYYYMAADETAAVWQDPVLIASGLGNFGGRCNLAQINGVPTVTYYNMEESRIYYRSATDINGIAWNEPVVIASEIGDFGGGSALASIGGNPAVAWGTGDEARYRRALSPDASAWSPSVTLETGEILGSPITLLEIGGLPHVCYTVNYVDIHYARLVDQAGTEPFDIYHVSGPGWGTSSDFNLFNVDGLPALMYVGFFLRPQDSSCQSWNDPVETCYGLQDTADPKGCLFTFRDQLVAVNQNAGLYYCPSRDAAGTDWGKPQLLDADCDNYHRVLGAAVVNNRLYTVFYPLDDASTEDPEHMVCRVIY